jgi:ABC-type multidrug transport system ATPase subunit
MMRNVKEGRLNIELVANSLGLTSKTLNSPVSQLSGGNKRQLSIALALVGEAKVLILDEPTANLDLVARTLVWNYIHSIKADSGFSPVSRLILKLP